MNDANKNDRKSDFSNLFGDNPGPSGKQNRKMTDKQ